MCFVGGREGAVVISDKMIKGKRVIAQGKAATCTCACVIHVCVLLGMGG